MTLYFFNFAEHYFWSINSQGCTNYFNLDLNIFVRPLSTLLVLHSRGSVGQVSELC